jgi:hypothetical protein
MRAMDWQWFLSKGIRAVVVSIKFRLNASSILPQAKKVIVCEYCGRILVDKDIDTQE